MIVEVVIGVSKEYEEIKKWTFIDAAKAAGKVIRKEALKRLALTAKINLPLAKGLLNEVDKLSHYLPKSNLKPSIPIEDTIMDRISNVIQDINGLIEVANAIISNLVKEGILLPRITPLEVRGQDLISLASALESGRQKLELIIEFFERLAKYEKM